MPWEKARDGDSPAASGAPSIVLAASGAESTQIGSIQSFLIKGTECLDYGTGLLLQQLALRGRTHTKAVAWIQSKFVKDLPEVFVLRLEGTSLPPERKFAQMKKWE